MGESWQCVLDRCITKAVEGGLLDRMKHTASEEELIRSFSNPIYTRELSEWVRVILNDTSRCKSSAKARFLREHGNTCFRTGDYEKSLTLYNKSIKSAPAGSEELCLSYANRSAALVHLQLYEDCLLDINRAFDNGYPVNLHYKLHQRRAECLRILGSVTEVINEYNKALELVERSKRLSAEKKKIISGVIENSIIAARKGNEREDPARQNKKLDLVPLPHPAHGTSEDFPSASQAVIVTECREKGRFVVTQCDIETGDVIFVEKPFAFVLLPEFYNRRCHHCCKQLSTPVPCCKCTIPLYCNEGCRDDSWKKYHKWECYGGLNVARAVGIAHLGLRVTLNAGTLEEHRSFRNRPTSGNDSYSAVYYLVTHLSDMSVEDRISYTLTAICLTLYLKNHTNYFTSSTGSESLQCLSDDHIFVGAIILRHICQLVCNGHAIVDLEKLEKQGTLVQDLQQVRIASAIYPSASMMNHSCDPNIINSFNGVYLIVKACKNIPSGQEVFNCYGPNYRTMPRRERQEALKAQYYFDCVCEKCSSPYDFQERFKALKCPECSGALVRDGELALVLFCMDCKHRLEISSSKILLGLAEKGHDLYVKASALLKSGSEDDALREFIDCHDIQQKCLHPLHEEVRGCLNSMAKCYALAGNFRKSIEYFQRTLPAVSEQYGLQSIEMANELQTLTDVMIRDILETRRCGLESVKEACEIAQQKLQEAKSILNLFYGPWDFNLQDITQKEEILKDVMQNLPL